MGFFKKKEWAIDRRIRDLQREMSRLDTDIKDRSRLHKDAGEQEAGDGARSAVSRSTEPVSGPVRQFPVYPRVPAPSAKDAGEAGPSAAPQPADAGRSINDLFANVRKNQPEDDRQPDLFAASPPGFSKDAEQHSGGAVSARERFANYFMDGHFQTLRPLRRERRMVRNRAIFALVLAVILAVFVWKLFF